MSDAAANRLRKWCEARWVVRSSRGESGIIQLNAEDLREAMVVALDIAETIATSGRAVREQTIAEEIHALIEKLKAGQP